MMVAVDGKSQAILQGEVNFLDAKSELAKKALEAQKRSMAELRTRTRNSRRQKYSLEDKIAIAE
jgi:hypothetical protein